MTLNGLRLNFCFLTITLCSLGLFSCQQTEKESIASIDPKIEIDIIRYDQLLNDLQEESLLEGFEALQNTYPSFTKLLSREVWGANNEQLLLEELNIITRDSGYQKSYEDVQSMFSNIEDLKEPISQGIENYFDLFNYDKVNLPTIYTFISGFTYQTFLFDDGNKEGIGVGLDMFLGADFPYAQINPSNPSFSSYLTRTFNKDHMVKKIVEVLVEDELPAPAKSDFLHIMIWGGKKLYLMDQILNFVPDTIITQYTAEQLEWCRENESQMWNHFFDQELFYETNINKFNKLVGPAPTSPGMPAESPGGTGNYMGWQIVRSFMKRNPQMSIRDLINLHDAQKLLDQSRYRPVRR